MVYGIGGIGKSAIPPPASVGNQKERSRTDFMPFDLPV